MACAPTCTVLYTLHVRRRPAREWRLAVCSVHYLLCSSWCGDQGKERLPCRIFFGRRHRISAVGHRSSLSLLGTGMVLSVMLSAVCCLLLFVRLLYRPALYCTVPVFLTCTCRQTCTLHKTERRVRYPHFRHIRCRLFSLTAKEETNSGRRHGGTVGCSGLAVWLGWLSRWLGFGWDPAFEVEAPSIVASTSRTRFYLHSPLQSTAVHGI